MTEPRVFVPHDYQEESLDWLYGHQRCALWAPMGGGKTIVTLTALENLSVVDEVYPVLVLAPKRVALSTWVNEVGKWAHTKHLRVQPVFGTAREREAALRVPADIYTCSYDLLDWLCEHLKGKWPFKTVVADELTKLKSFRLGQGGKRARALGRVAHTDVKRFIGLTGTPAPNGIKDLWGAVWFLDAGQRLGKSFSAFESRWFKKGFDGYSLVPYDHSQAEVERLLSDICLTVRGLPTDKPIETPVYVDLDAKTRELYRRMERDFFAEIEAIGVEAANSAVKSSKLRQLASGAILTEDDGWKPVHNLKLEALESIVSEANGMPVLVQYDFVADRERILKHFKQARFLDANPKTEDAWNRGEIGMLVASAASAGHGLNLQEGGNILARYSYDWNHEYFAQILERIGPLRQKQAGLDRPVHDYRIVARDTIDETVLERHDLKCSVQDALLKALERRKERE